MNAAPPNDSPAARATASVNMALAGGAIVGTWFWDVTNDQLTVDAYLARAFGLDPALAGQKLQLHDVLGAIHPDDLPGLTAAIDAAVRDGDRFAHPYRARGEDGQYHWLEGIGRIERDARGRATGFPGVLIDIDERLRVQAERDQAQALLRSFMEAAPGVMYAKDRKGRLLMGNHGATELIGLPPQQYVGRTDAELLGDPAQAAAVMATDERIMASGRTEQLEEKISFADGRQAWWLSTKAPLRDADGTVIGLVGTSLDITDRKAAEAALADSEERLRLATEASEQGFWDVDLVRDLLIWPARTKAMFGISAGAHVTMDDFRAGLHPDDREATLAALDAAADPARRASYDVEYRTVGKEDGIVRWVAAKGRGIFEHGQCVRMLGVAIDITRRKAADARLQELNEQLEARVHAEVAERLRVEDALRQSRKMEAVGQLTGGIAHDFNNMLATVIGPLDLLALRIDSGDSRAHRYIEMALDGAQRAAQLTQRLLAFSRQQPLQPVALDSNHLLAGMSDLLVHSLGSSIMLETVLARDLWWTHADANQLENVILNLAVNARDAMPGGGHLKVETGNCRIDIGNAASHPGIPAGDYVLIAVSDTGTGMAPDVQARAFDPFFTTKDVGQGTGLGLSQVYGFVQQSAGHVALDSNPGAGTCVRVYLPRLLGEASPSARPPSRSPATPPDGGAEHILVVDDDEAVRRFSVDALTELGYDVLSADGAASALPLLDAHPSIALLFTDVVMPEVNGRQLAEQALARRPGLKVLYATGNSRNALVDDGVLDARVQLIGKPFTIDELATRVRVALAQTG